MHHLLIFLLIWFLNIVEVASGNLLSVQFSPPSAPIFFAPFPDKLLNRGTWAHCLISSPPIHSPGALQSDFRLYHCRTTVPQGHQHPPGGKVNRHFQVLLYMISQYWLILGDSLFLPGSSGFPLTLLQALSLACSEMLASPSFLA